MDLTLYESVCGEAPVDFIIPNITDNNFIFEVDPNFTPLNLNSFLGNFVTVNSFTECVHYMNGGYGLGKTTIFDLLFLTLGIGALIYSTYKFLKLGIHKKISLKIKIIFSKIGNLKTEDIKKSKFYKPALFLMLFIQNYFIFDYVRTKSSRIPRFIDEYISLNSNLNFYKYLDFNAGAAFGGSYSTLLTSGPISAIGGVIGWTLTSKLTIARISNFYWLIFLQLILSYLLIRKNKHKQVFILFSTSLIFLLTPWWQSSLYMIGEFASVILFTNAVFLFLYHRKLALVLFSFSIFYGKLLSLLPFSIFYLFQLRNKRKINLILNDIFYFSLPLILWGILINFNYDYGNLYVYLGDLFNLIQSHQSSGVNFPSESNLFNFLSTFSTSEASSWNKYELVRVLIVPIIFIILLRKNKVHIDSFFGNIVNPLIASTLSIYLWFWILSPTKWIRYSQHFTLVVLISLLYILNFEVIKTKFDIFLSLGLIAIFIDNSKYLILVFIIFAILIFQNINILRKEFYAKFLLVLIITLDISIPFFEKNSITNVNDQIPECVNNFSSNECRIAYLSNN
tara:strand:- start:37 stop:1734 length:1698 start_codon:yes stop_codon:yes gene_type:complete